MKIPEKIKAKWICIKRKDNQIFKCKEIAKNIFIESDYFLEAMIEEDEQTIKRSKMRLEHRVTVLCKWNNLNVKDWKFIELTKDNV